MGQEMKLLKEITLLTEAAGVLAIPTTKKIEGESIWGMDGFNPSNKPIEDQVKAYINKMVSGADEEELQHFYDEVKRVIFVPKKVVTQVLKAYKKLHIAGDSENDVANAFAQHLLVDAATKTVAVNLKLKKKK